MVDSQANTAKEWADMVIVIWIEQMVKLGVENAYVHANSFVQTVIANANGNVSRIEFTFDYFLRFTDMGVGNGTKISERGNSKRFKKQWYTKTFLREVRIFTEIMAQQYGRRSQIIIFENTNDNSTSLRTNNLVQSI